MIWKTMPEPAIINQINDNTMVSHLGIEVTEIGNDYIKAKMPVDHRTKQPMGLLHGGASAVLSESMGSVASWMVSGDTNKAIVGLEINANHLKSAHDGYVHSITRPVRLGNTIHVWDTEIRNDQDELVCVSRLTVMVRDLMK